MAEQHAPSLTLDSSQDEWLQDEFGMSNPVLLKAALLSRFLTNNMSQCPDLDVWALLYSSWTGRMKWHLKAGKDQTNN